MATVWPDSVSGTKHSLACLFSDGHCPVIVPALNVYPTDKLPAFVTVQDLLVCFRWTLSGDSSSPECLPDR